MARDDEEDGERLYDLQEAAELLGKTEAALRMQIRRDSIPAVKRPLDDTGRFKYVIPESEIEKERQRLRTSTRRSETQRAPSASTISDWRGDPPPRVGEDQVRQEHVGELQARVDRLERDHERERQDTRALIRALENQVELLRMMVSTLTSGRGS